MCGIAGLIHRGQSSDVGAEMTKMLQALKHRGPDSTGFAVYGEPVEGQFVMRFKVAEREDMERKAGREFDINDKIAERIDKVEKRLAQHGAEIVERENATPYALRYIIRHEGETEEMARDIESVEGCEILSLGNALELIKDLGDAGDVAGDYKLEGFRGTHGIGHTRMATESDVDIRSAHPYWAFPYNDVSVVHNGQLTNYWIMRREMERKGHRFVSNCDSELLAVYTAHNLANGVALEESLRRSIKEIDGVFTYLVATRDQLGMAKDTMAAKPLVLYESDDLIAMASEEVAIRAILPQEIDTVDPYDEEVRVWQA
ncbi:MAG TPA: glutamine amidotransferase [Thermohalobaculum sp.]|nr:glutamine amidotransferase [Thermohalobaculum sp.]